MTDFSQGPPPSRSRHSFAAFYKANISTVVRILGRIGVHSADIPDIAQQIFLKIYKDCEKHGLNSPDVSLDTICRQQAANHYRLHRNRFEEPEPNVGEEMPSDDEDAQTQLEHHELDQIVQRILDEMTPEFRDLLVRREFKKESLESIAEAHNMARNTATARIAEAKRIFRLRAKRILGDKNLWLLAIPWAIQARDLNADLSDDFIADMQDQVWRGIARELGFSDEYTSEVAVREADYEPPPSKPRTRTIAALVPWSKPLLGFLAKPVLLLGAGIVAGIAGASLWPHASPAIARRMPSLPVVVFEHDAAKEMPGVAMPLIATTVVMTAPPKASLAPLVDNELRTLQRARALIAQGSYADALAALRQHEKEFPRSEYAAIRSQYITLAEEGLRKAAGSSSAR
ncbi:MAG TPA: sigma-70 family RNA polymerase sigma factor [Polyangium sp.]|nr:sigma-70 family RNA polymerase sigma factor [Polyangium sp.]